LARPLNFIQTLQGAAMEPENDRTANGASVMRDIQDIPTGQMMYMKHTDGCMVEYVQWTPDLVE